MQSFVRTSRIRRKISIATLTSLSMFTLASCEGDDEIPGRIVITSSPSMTVTPKASALSVGGTQQLTAQVKDGNGNVINLPITWTSSDPEVVTVSESGLVTAVDAGNGSVVASASNGARSSASFTVISSVADLQIVGSDGLLAVGSSRTFTVTPLDDEGRPVAATVSSWSSSNPGVATVTAIGSSVDNTAVVTAIGEGSTTITATVNGQTKTITIPAALLTASLTLTPSPLIVARGSTGQITATARDGQNNVLAGRVVTYEIESSNGTTVSAGGLVSVPGSGFGSSFITASTTDQGGTVTSELLVNPLLNGQAQTAVAGVEGDEFFYLVNVPAGTTGLVVTMGGGTGDPDVFLIRPDGTQACASERAGGLTETCTAAAPLTPGIWTFRVLAFSDFAGWTITAAITPAP